jgi:hypothetical protein
MERSTLPTRFVAWGLMVVVLAFAGVVPTSATPGAEPDRQGPAEPNFAGYYDPVILDIEPNVVSYKLPLDLGLLTNYDRVNQVFSLDTAKDVLRQNGFAVIEEDPGGDDIVSPYSYLFDLFIPIFVTTDTLLHVYHVQFDETLQEIEESEFYDDVLVLTDALGANALKLQGQLEGDLQEAARRNVAYLSVAARLIGSSSPVPPVVSEEVTGELASIAAHSGFKPSDIFIYNEDYSQYVPRGHYTRSGRLERYFKTLMWYGRMAFLLKGDENWGPQGKALISPYDARIQTLQACLLAISLNTQQVDHRSARNIWDRMYAVTALYVGLADDLIPYDYLWALDRVFGPTYTLAELDDPDRLYELKTELALLPSPQIFGGTGGGRITPPLTEDTLNEILDETKGMRLMGQRFVPDSYMFQNLVVPRVGKYAGDFNDLPFTAAVTPDGIFRGYPRGLDVMALLGSQQARDILVQEGDTAYTDYEDRFNELAEEFGAFSSADWNRNLYWGWLYSLRALLGGFGEGYPSFMQTPAWSKRFLNASLASWTELRHDTILYAKQSYSGGPFSEPPTPACYVEPVPEFFGRLLALTRMTRAGLSDMAALSDKAEKKLVYFEEMLERLIAVATKELTNRSLTGADYEYLAHLAQELEWQVLSVSDYVGLKTTLVADVHTCVPEERVLEEAVGKVDLVVVACPQSDGLAFLAVGPVLSYYEFKQPMGQRLTDEAWRELLDSPDRPERPAWYLPLVP